MPSGRAARPRAGSTGSDWPGDGDGDASPQAAESRRGAAQVGAASPRSPDVAQADHLPDVEDAEQSDDQQHQDRDRRAEAEVAFGIALLEQVDAHQVVRLLDVRLPDKQERLREDAEVPDDGEA